jgi:cysteine desulfurase/selenocysteine lyase
VLEKLVEFYRFYRASPGRSIHSASRKAEEKLKDARKIAAEFINASTDEIVFNRNTTEGLNMVASGLKMKKGGNIVVSALEHHSNFLPWMRRCEKDGREFRIFIQRRRIVYLL